MKRKPTLTKRERKAAAPPRPAQHQHQHIHCIACGLHLNASDFGVTATQIQCDHGSTFATCMGCVSTSRALLAEHDRTGQPVKSAAAWH